MGQSCRPISQFAKAPSSDLSKRSNLDPSLLPNLFFLFISFILF